ncbi:MAG: hypothetical protein AB7K63_10555 [Vicinamibacterales bacterium]
MLMFAGGPAAAAACAIDCAPPEAAQATSGCHEHPAQGQADTRVVALHICDENARLWPVTTLQPRVANAGNATPAPIVSAQRPTDPQHACGAVPRVGPASVAVALSSILRI